MSCLLCKKIEKMYINSSNGYTKNIQINPTTGWAQFRQQNITYLILSGKDYFP